MDTEQEYEYDDSVDNGNFIAEQTFKWVLGLSLGIMFIVALMLQFNKISLMLTLTILFILSAICLIIKLSFRKVDTKKKTAGTGHNQGRVLIAYYTGLLIFMIITISTSLWILYSMLGMYFNFWIKLIFAVANLTLWGIWSKYSFDQTYEGAVLLQLKLNGEYKKWGKNMRPAWWGVCKVFPFIGWLEGKLEKFSEEKFIVTHEVFKTEKGSEDGAVLSVKVDDDSGNSFPVVVKFEAPARICDTYIIATTEEKEKGAKKQLVPKIFGGLMTLLNDKAKNHPDGKPKKVEGFDPIRPYLSDEAEKIMLPCFNSCGFELIKGFNLTAVEPTTVEELSRSKARARVSEAIGEVAAEKIKVDGTAVNIETVTGKGVSPDVAVGAVLAVQSDAHRQDTNITSSESQPGKKGGSKGSTKAGVSQQAAVFAALDNHSHGGGKSGE